MILVYDGVKTLFIEGISQENPLSADEFMAARGSNAQAPVIIIESVVSTGSKPFGTILAGVPVGKMEDRTVLLNFAALNLVWIRNVTTEEALAAGILDRYVQPVWNKISELVAAEKAKHKTNSQPKATEETVPPANVQDNLDIEKQSESQAVVVGTNADLL